MNYEKFRKNVHAWSDARGIYEHSTPLAQALKAVSEVGEAADAVIKNSIDDLKDGIGDTMFCLENVAKMVGIEIAPDDFVPHEDLVQDTAQGQAAVAAVNVSRVALAVSCGSPTSLVMRVIAEAMRSLSALTRLCEVGMDECLSQAWDAVKDRQGRMVAGGAFVKDE